MRQDNKIIRFSTFDLFLWSSALLLGLLLLVLILFLHTVDLNLSDHQTFSSSNENISSFSYHAVCACSARRECFSLRANYMTRACLELHHYGKQNHVKIPSFIRKDSVCRLTLRRKSIMKTYFHFPPISFTLYSIHSLRIALTLTFLRLALPCCWIGQ